MREIEIWTDGACVPNPGTGGCAAIVIDKEEGTYQYVREGHLNTTNNRMEILGVIIGLELLKSPCNVIVYSDSQYVCGTVNTFLWKNVKQGTFGEMKNQDLWRRYVQGSKIHRVKAVWIKAHCGNSLNEICDNMASDVLKETLEQQKNIRHDF